MTQHQFYEAERISREGYQTAEPVDAGESWWTIIAAAAAMVGIAVVGWAGISQNEQKIEAMEKVG